MPSKKILFGILGLQITVLGGIMVLTSASFYSGTDWIYVPWLGLLPTLLALVLSE